MWEPGFSLGGILIVGLWAAALLLIGLGWILDLGPLGHFGILCCAGGATLSVMRDNQRTRRMLARPDEQLASVRRPRA